jgi:hypothetical protein
MSNPNWNDDQHTLYFAKQLSVGGSNKQTSASHAASSSNAKNKKQSSAGGSNRQSSATHAVSSSSSNTKNKKQSSIGGSNKQSSSVGGSQKQSSEAIERKNAIKCGWIDVPYNWMIMRKKRSIFFNDDYLLEQ